MPNDTTPLLPPDPSRSGFYYLTKPEWTGSIRDEIWRWSASDHTNGWSCHWQHESRAPMAAEWAARAGYTLAIPHRIPTPGELERLHKLADDFKREAREGSEGVQADYRMIAICTAQADADMLRAALEDK